MSIQIRSLGASVAPDTMGARGTPADLGELRDVRPGASQPEREWIDCCAFPKAGRADSSSALLTLRKSKLGGDRRLVSAADEPVSKRR